MTITSYAQNFEDVILWRALKHVERGFYIDIGAQDPVIDSVSLAFYEKGWRGVHVEASSHYAEKLRKARPDEEVIEAAIGKAVGEVQFFEIPDSGLSTGEEEIARQHEAEGWTVVRSTVPCQPLSSILDAYKDREIHWLKIDVEGMEKDVIEGWPPSSVRPWIVVIESTSPSSPVPSHMIWEAKLLKLGYDFVYFDGVNRFYVSNEHPELKVSFGPGPNFFDAFVLSRSTPFCKKINAETGELRQKITGIQTLLEGTRKELLEAQESSRRHRQEAEAQAAEIVVLEEKLTGERDARLVAETRLAEIEALLEGMRKELLEAQESSRRHRQEAEARAAEITALRASTSWRITAPMRAISRGLNWFLRGLRWFVRGIWAWVTLKPGSRPRRTARNVLVALARFSLARSWLSHPAKAALRRIPVLDRRIRQMLIGAPPIRRQPMRTSARMSPLSPPARRVYAELKDAIGRRQGKT